jgi:hypothetical protein
VYRQNWRLEDNPNAERAFRLGVKNELMPVTPTG